MILNPLLAYGDHHVAESDPSLSVVLSVHNAEKTLSDRVARLLEFLPDLVNQFELLIVDNGSTDQTEEVACELARHYPQMRVAHHPRPMSLQETEETALKHTSGDYVIIHSGEDPLPARTVCQLWEQRGRSRSSTPGLTATQAVLSKPSGSGDPITIYRRDGSRAMPRAPMLISRGNSDDCPTGSFSNIVARLVARRQTTNH